MKNDKGPKRQPFFKNPFFIILIASVLFSLLLNIAMTSLTAPKQQEIRYDEFMTMLENGEVKTVVLSSDKITVYKKSAEELQKAQEEANADKTITQVAGELEQSADIIAGEATAEPSEQPEPTMSAAMSVLNMYGDVVSKMNGETVYYTGYIYDERLLEKLDTYDVEYYTPYSQTSPLMEFFVTWILPLGIMYLIFFLIMRMLSKKMGGGMMGGVGKSNAKVYMESKTGVTFQDVAGQEEAKESLNEIVDFLHNPGKYTAIGAKQPKGALLVGPPGTGKTLLAKAVAGEAKVPFFSLSGSEFVEMFVGVGASRVRDLFKQAADKAPCIIFIDEIDAIGKSRDTQLSTNDEREQTLNQLLAEMDGFDSSKGVVILAATNRPEVLDKALLRPGRFDRRIIVEKPDLKGREEILKVHSKNVKMDPDIDLHEIALATSGAVGADLANIVNEAALRAVRMGRRLVLQEDLMEAVEIIIAGKEKKDRILSKKEKRIVAFHEVGHALASALQKNTQPVQKITIVPRTMGALGYTLQVPEEERYLMTKEEIIDQITVYLAGRAAEELVFGLQTTGASNDIEQATNLARSMIAQYGMSDKFGMAGLESIQNRYLDGRNVSNCSEETKTVIDNEIVSLLKSCHDKAYSLLESSRKALDEIAEFLIERETITGAEFMDILNRVRREENMEEIPLAKSEDKTESIADTENPAIPE